MGCFALHYNSHAASLADALDCTYRILKGNDIHQVHINTKNGLVSLHSLPYSWSSLCARQSIHRSQVDARHGMSSTSHLCVMLQRSELKVFEGAEGEDTFCTYVIHLWYRLNGSVRSKDRSGPQESKVFRGIVEESPRRGGLKFNIP